MERDRVRRRVGVVGLGVCNVVASSVEEFAQAVLFDSWESGPFVLARRWPLDFEVLVGAIPEQRWPTSSESLFETETGRLCLFAARQAHEDALAGGGLPAQALILGTSTGGQAASEAALASLREACMPDFALAREGVMCSPTRLVAEQLEISGEVMTVSTACTSSANAIALGAGWIRSGRFDRVLVGGGDALCQTTLASFYNLQLTKQQACRPFGEERPGMSLGEGAAFLMLESMETIESSGRTPLAELMGIGLSSDAHHMTGPDPEGTGAASAMQAALDDAGVLVSEIHYINAHGTGTRLNDATEAKAIERLFGRVPVSSIKGLTGHTLAASGAMEAVLAVLSLEHRRAPANHGALSAGGDCPIELVSGEGLALPAGALILSNSFAFGGNNCSLLFGPGALEGM